jgi:S1-C subfamily serine protease
MFLRFISNTFFYYTVFFFLISCHKEQKKNEATSTVNTTATTADSAKLSVLRVNSTTQSWNPMQPWEKNNPNHRSALAPLIYGNFILTTAELVADATFIELETTDGIKRSPAKVVAIDYEANLALLTPEITTEKPEIFQNLSPLEIAANPKIKESIEIIQVEESGLTLVTPGVIQSAEANSTFLPEHFFLNFVVKTSLQPSNSSYSLPVLNDGKLAGVLSSYDAKDQICYVISTPLISKFIADAKDGQYDGFPSLGINVSNTEDSLFREWLKIPTEEGGVYVSKVKEKSAAEIAGLKKGDVILEVGDKKIDRRGYYIDNEYGSIYWVQLVRGSRAIGDSLNMKILREGKIIALTAKLIRSEKSDELVPSHMFDKAPNYLVKGGLIFQELTRPLLEAYGKDWETRAPLKYLDVLGNPDQYEKNYDHMVCLTAVIPTPATIGYENARNLILAKVNGKSIRNMKEAITAFEKAPLGVNYHTLEFIDENIVIYLDDKLSTNIDKALLKRGIPVLFRAE